MDIKAIVSNIADFFGFTYAHLLSRNISHDVSKARNFAFYVLHFDYGLSSNVIAKAMNRASRHVVRQNATTKYLIENFKVYKDIYQKLKHKLNTI